jgi:hemerythrin-like domain-containing protein
MEATNILREEHRVIERVLAALETATDHLLADRSISPTFFLQSAEFIKGFADGRHHKKEEGVLFPAMEAAGIPADGGPIGVMLAEHDEGRRLVASMLALADKMISGDATAKEQLVQATRGYTSLLRAHILKEEGILFPMAEQAIQGVARAEVAEAFDRIEHEETGEGVQEKFLALAESLEQQVAG